MRATDAPTSNVLLVDDDLELAAMLADALGVRNYRVWHATTAAEARMVVDEVRPDVILLDLMLPDRNGLIVCASLKGQAGVPVIVCSASKRKDDPALAFKLGADDFIPKPFSVDELQARMEAAVRRAAPPSSQVAQPTADVLRVDGLVIDRRRCRVTLAGRPVQLTPTEYRLLCALASRPGHVLTRQELADAVWGAHDDGILRSLDVHMRRLRCKLRSGSAAAPRLETRRGFGYQLVDEPPGGG